MEKDLFDRLVKAKDSGEHVAFVRDVCGDVIDAFIITVIDVCYYGDLIKVMADDGEHFIDANDAKIEYNADAKLCEYVCRGDVIDTAIYFQDVT